MRVLPGGFLFPYLAVFLPPLLMQFEKRVVFGVARWHCSEATLQTHQLAAGIVMFLKPVGQHQPRRVVVGIAMTRREQRPQFGTVLRESLGLCDSAHFLVPLGPVRVERTCYQIIAFLSFAWRAALPFFVTSVELKSINRSCLSGSR